MDYSKRLGKSVENLEKVSEEISKLGNLIETAAQSNEEIKRYNENLEKYLKKETVDKEKLKKEIHDIIVKDTEHATKVISEPIKTARNDFVTVAESLSLLFGEQKKLQEEILAAVKKDLDKFTELTQNYTKQENSAREKFTKEFHDFFAKDSEQFLKKVTSPLENVKADLVKNVELLSSLISENKKLQETMFTAVEQTLKKYNTKHLDIYNNLSDTLSNKIESNSSRIESTLSTDFSQLQKILSSTSGKIEARNNELADTLKNVMDSFNAMNKHLKSIDSNLDNALTFLKATLAATLSMGLAILATNFLSK